MSRSERVSIQIPSAPQPAFDAETAVRERYQQAAQTFEPSLCCAVKYDGRWPAKFALCRNRPPPSLHFSTKRPAPFEFSGTVLETRSINALGKANRQWTDAAGDTSNSGYDKGGNRVSATDGKSETTTYVFDARGRQIKQVDRLAGETEFAYTDTGQLASLTDAENQVTSYTYDDAGRKASEAFTMGGQTYTTGLDYDAAGQLIEYTYPDGSVVARSYNDRGQLYQISFDSTVIDTRAYDDGGRMTSSTYNNGVGETRAYNVDNTLASITFSGASIGTYSYGWDDNKNKTSETITGAMSGYGFAVGSSGYDEEDRLLNWERTDSNLDQSWDLSLVGDWDSFTENSSTQNRTHGPTHELLTAGGQSLTHDTKGNMTLIPSGLRSNASSLALTWDFENKMKTADIGNNSSVDVTYKWDALGRRVYRDDGTSAFVYVQVGQQTIADYGWSVAPASPKYNYVYASYIDEPVMREEPSANERLFFHRSQQFSTVALTTSSATIAERYAYSAYGAPTVCNASGTDIGSSTKDNRMSYTGREWDDELVLYHFRARLYDAAVGRFYNRTTDVTTGAISSARVLHYGFTGQIDGGWALSTPDSGNCFWWLYYYLRDVREVSLHDLGYFDEWLDNVRLQVEDEMTDVLGRFDPYLSCDKQRGFIKEESKVSGSFSTQVYNVPLCSRIGPVGGSSVKYTATCTAIADCRKCKPCDVFSQESNSIFGKKTCKFRFSLKDQWSNPGDFGGAHNKPRDLDGFHNCLDRCSKLGGRVGMRCVSKCRAKFLIGDKVPVITDPYPETYPYWITANWSDEDDELFVVPCGSRP